MQPVYVAQGFHKLFAIDGSSTAVLPSTTVL